jgi:hypothetical protein
VFVLTLPSCFALFNVICGCEILSGFPLVFTW